MTATEAVRSERPREALPLSLAAYRALGEMGMIPERTELLYGQVYPKVPEAPLHTFLFMSLLEPLQRAVPPSMHVRPEKPIVCSGSEPVPDIAVVRGSIHDYVAEHPSTAEFIIEVCVSSHDYDRSKLRAYANAGVKEVWLVLAPEKQIEAHRQPMSGQFRERIVFGPEGEVRSTGLSQFAVDLDTLFASQQK